MSDTIIIDGKERVIDPNNSWDRLMGVVYEIEKEIREFHTPVRSIDNHLKLNYELANLIINHPDSSNLFSLGKNYDRRDAKISFEDFLKPYMEEGTIFVFPRNKGIIFEKVGQVLSEGYVENNDLYQIFLERMLEIDPEYLNDDIPHASRPKDIKKSLFGYRTMDLGHILLGKDEKNLFLSKNVSEDFYCGKRVWNECSIEPWSKGAYILTSEELIDGVNKVYTQVEQNYQEHGDRVTLELV